MGCPILHAFCEGWACTNLQNRIHQSLLLPLPLLFGCHSRRESAFAFAFAFALAVVLALAFWLSFPKGICFCRCRCFSFRTSPQENLFTTKLQEPCNKGTPSADDLIESACLDRKRWELIEISASSFADNYEQKAHNRFNNSRAATKRLRTCKITTHIGGKKGSKPPQMHP